MAQASEKLRSQLQQTLTHLIDLSLQGKQAHWNIVGPNFRDLHLQLDVVINLARNFADVVAERMRALEVPADGRAQTIAKTSQLAPLSEGLVETTPTIDVVVAQIKTTVNQVRDIRDSVEEEDPATADILHTIILDLEKQAWMMGAENAHATTTQGSIRRSA